MTIRKFGALSSSVDPSQFSLTAESALKVIGALLSTLAMIKGVDSSGLADNIKQLGDAFTLIVGAGITIWHSGSFLFGLVRKLAAKKEVPQG